VSVVDELQWDAQGLIPAVVQDTETGQLLMVAWMSRDSLEATRRSGLTHFWSRARQTLWRKGETSGHAQHVDGLYADCDRDTLLVQVHQDGAACHTGARSCFFTSLDDDGMSPAFGSAGPTMLEVLERVLESRKVGPPPGSYVAGLFRKGEAQICRKIGEEAAEVMTAALGGEGDARVVSEIADLWFHTMVLLTARGIPLRRVFQELGSRHAKGK
jgi:phosphoribosyl-ATP pyrophosphohydrolase/phosphoribosyl-AMP cyclohydrolase